MQQLSYAQKEAIGFNYVLDCLRPASPYGQELVRNLTPFSRGQEQELLRQLQNIQKVVEAHPQVTEQQNRFLRILMRTKMLRPTAKKCLEADLNEIELFELKRFLLQSWEILPLWQNLQAVWALECVPFADTQAALDILDPQKNRVAAFFLEDSRSPLLHQLRQEKRDLEAALREQNCIDRDGLQARRGYIAAREEQEEIRIRHELSVALRPYIPAILSNMDVLGELDFTLEKARLATQYGGVLPELTKSEVVMQDMLQPQLADRLGAQGKCFTPISITLEPGAAVVTGANMGGKSVALKTLALNLYLIHCGIFPFAKSAAAPLFDSFHILAEDKSSLEQGLSSFGGEIVSFNEIIRAVDQGFAFVLLDEFARGTNPQEGAALVQAVTQYLNSRQVIAVLATHYDQVAPYGNVHYQVVGLRDMNPENIVRELAGLQGQEGVDVITKYMNYGLYRLQGESSCPRDAFHICQLLGMKQEILSLAEKTAEKP